MKKGRIKELDNRSINRIAAGEVIERPFSVVKELVENSLDANATHIKVRISEGGQKNITVEDNGSGINVDDLALSFARHATSKISSADELFTISSFGFRGEALASISSIARVTLKTNDGVHGASIRCDGGQLSTPQPVARAQGTTISVDDIFFNTPARRKFLKSHQTEWNHIIGYLRRVAMANKGVEFSIEHNGKSFAHWRKTDDLKKRIQAVLGDELADTLIELNVAEPHWKIYGFISAPRYSRAQRDQQYLFVNNRPVRDNTIALAVKRGYRDVLYHDRQPVYVLFVDIDADKVDVNVHPAKTEVRFQEVRDVSQSIARAVYATLSQPMISDLVSHASDTQYDGHSAAITERADYSHSTSSNFVGARDFSRGGYGTERANDVQQLLSGYRALSEEYNFEGEQGELVPGRYIKPLAQLHGIYVLAETERGLVVIDMHAAHERIVYENLKKQYREKEVAQQQILVPVEINLSIELEDEQYVIEKLNALGFGVSLANTKQLIVRSVPVLLGNRVEVESLVSDVLADFAVNGYSDRSDDAVDELLSRIACHASVRANRKLNMLEMEELVRGLQETERSDQCNHGRPTWHEVTISELDKWFKRGQ